MSLYLGTDLIAPAVTDTANKSLSNLNSTGKNIANWSSNVSNCITYIPQDIKLELDNGTLTLKAGSKVYVPNGSGVFNTVTIASDLMQSSFSTGTNTEYYLFYYNGVLRYFNKTQISSGSTAPSGGNYLVWYDTTNNVIKTSSDGGSTWNSGVSLPLCKFTATSNTITSIDQVFNGFGYIGSTVFALPGVKVQMPDGRNDDGTLKSFEYIIQSVLTFTKTGGSLNLNNFFLKEDGEFSYVQDRYNFYVETEEEANSILSKYSSSSLIIYVGNTNYHIKQTNGVITRNKLISGLVKVLFDSSYKVTSFYAIKTVFRALDWNDKWLISNWAMPSDKYIDLSLSSSGSTYTAHANGYYLLVRTGGTAGSYMNIINTATNFGAESYAQATNNNVFVWLPVKSGDTVSISYSANYTTTVYFRFIYAEGEI